MDVHAVRFVDTAASIDDKLRVRVPWLDGARTGVPVQWVPLPGPVLPVAGDLAWVTEAVPEDGEGNEWVVVTWLPAVALPSLVLDTDPRLAAPETVRLVGAAGQPAFQNSWVNYPGAFQPVGFYKDRSRVYVKGSVNRGASPLTATTIFTLPADYRPASTLVFATISSGSVIADVRVDATGNVSLASGAVGPGGTGSYLSLDAISFRI